MKHKCRTRYAVYIRLSGLPLICASVLGIFLSWPEAQANSAIQLCNQTGQSGESGPLSEGQTALLAQADRFLQKSDRAFLPEDIRCVKDPTDPYDPGARSRFGIYTGQCVDARTVRPVTILHEDDRSIEIANFYHNGRYWIATIPKDAVEEVIFQGIPFGKLPLGLGIEAHGQFRFKLKLGREITLREQAGTRQDRVVVDDLIVSSTYTAPHGVAYSIHGKNFGIATRVMSSTSRASEEGWKDGDIIRQFQTTMSPEVGSKLLITSIRNSAAAGYNQTYDILKNNCTTVALDNVDATVPPPPGVKPLRGTIFQISDLTIQPGLKALRARGFMPADSDNEVPSLNSELVCVEEQFPGGNNSPIQNFPDRNAVAKDNRLTPPCHFLKFQ